MRDDQWFSPGDKVMRVGNGLPERVAKLPNVPRVEFGRVYCVEDFWEGPEFNVITLVGIGGWREVNGMRCGWFAGAFRRVEEIQQIIKAVQKAPKPAKTFPAQTDALCKPTDGRLNLKQ